MENFNSDFEECISTFQNNWNEDPIEYSQSGIIVLKLYEIKRLDSVYQSGKRNIRDQITQRTNFFQALILDIESINSLKDYISLDNLTLTKELRNFAQLQQIENEYLSLTDRMPDGYSIEKTTVINKKKYNAYREHLKKVKLINKKASDIVKDKFQTDEHEVDSTIDTSAIFSNVGYIVKGFEGKYISLSKGDRTFVKNFMDDQIREGAYKLTIKETLPLYKEGIKEILAIGKELLLLNSNKTKIKSFSKKYLNEERKSLESCWQCYFDKYLRVLLMNYKEFYPQVVFRPLPGYEKDTRPDFLAVDIYNNVDVIEIKHHRTTLLRKEKGRDSYYPSSELNKAVFQLSKYVDLKTESIEIDSIKNEYTKSLIEHEKIYRPRGILIISSRDHIVSESTNDSLTPRLEKEIKKLKTTYNNIDIILFDELLTNLQNYVDYLDAMLT